MTAIDLAREVAHSAGVTTYSDDDLDYVLWEHTAFPWGGVPYLRRQLEEFFSKQQEKAR